MKYRRSTNEEIARGASHRVQDHLDPFLDTLQEWADGTVRDLKPWSGYDLEIRENVVHVDGFPLHPYVQQRLLSRVVGIRHDRLDRWREHPDLILEALGRFDPFDGDVQMRVVAGQVVVLTDVDMTFGDHIDYFAPMAEEIKRVSRGTVPTTLVGYVLDPLWAHVRLAYTSGDRTRPHATGLYLDANYLFNRSVRGRACYGLFAYDLVWKVDLTMDDWWSVRTPRIRPEKPADLHGRFLELLGKQGKNARKQARYTSSSLSHKRKKKPKPVWKNSVVSHFTKHYGAKARVQQALVEMDEKGHDSQFDFVLALLTTVQGVEFHRRLVAERYLSSALRKVS